MSVATGMNWGMLWFDDNPKVPFGVKVQQAAARYQAKYGQIPDLCFVNPHTVGVGEQSSGKVQVIVMPHIQPNHFWLGMKVTTDESSSRQRVRKLHAS